MKLPDTLEIAEKQSQSATKTAPLQMDSVIIGDETYELLEHLGEGGMANAYKARDEKGKNVLIKIFKSDDHRNADKELLESSLKIRRIHAEIPSNKLQWPIAENLTEKLCIIAYEFIEGICVKEILLNFQVQARILKIKKLIGTIMETTDDIAKVGLVHRDGKLQNIIMQDQETLAGYIDIDILCHVSNRDKEVLGTPYCMDPNYLKYGILNSRTDSYALACSFLYETISYNDLMNTGIGLFNLSMQIGISQRVKYTADMLKVLRDPTIFQESERADTYGLMEYFIHALDPNPDKRPKNKEEVVQILNQRPNISMI